MTYCKRCLLPSTKPGLEFDSEGICGACRNYENRKEVDYATRMEELKKILSKYKRDDYYDCIVPCSGGKDSTFQTLKMLELGMHPLCVTATTDKLSDIGRANIENLKSLGVDYIEVTANPKVRRKINKIALGHVGDISWPEHVTIFTIPVRIAVAMKIPLIIWGENSQNEYGGPAGSEQSPTLDRAWLEKFGGMCGLETKDLPFSKKDLIPYTYPSDEELKEVGVTGLFLGHYVPWDGPNNAFIAQAHGLTTYSKNVEGSVVNYENLDNLQMRIHDYFKFLKFGYDRCTDWASIYIRRGRITREEGRQMVLENEGKFPWEYLGCRLEEVLKDIEMSLVDFKLTCDSYTTRALFKTDLNGDFIRDKHGDLIKVDRV